MRQAISVLVLLLVIVGCKTSRKFYGIDVQSGPCKGLDNFLQTNWNYEEENKIYQLKQSSTSETLQSKYGDCFMSLDTATCFRILGQPSEVTDVGFIKYYFTTDCYSEWPSNCQYLQLTYNRKNGKIVSIGTGGGGWMH